MKIDKNKGGWGLHKMDKHQSSHLILKSIILKQFLVLYNIYSDLYILTYLFEICADI